MGVNAPNVTQVLHFGPPSSAEQYLQEIGRAGRLGQASSAKLFYKATDVSSKIVANGFIDMCMHDYCLSTETCLREQLLKYFGFKKSNTVGQCCSNCSPPNEIEDTTPQTVVWRTITPQGKLQLKEEFDNILEHYNESLTEPLAWTFNVRDNGDVKQKLLDILDNVEEIHNEDSLLTHYDLWDEELSKQCIQAIDKYTVPEVRNDDT